MPTYVKRKKKVYKKAKRYAKKFFKSRIRRPKYDKGYRVTCDTSGPLLNLDLNQTYPGGAQAAG